MAHQRIPPGCKLIFRWSFIHPVTGKRVYSKNGRPIPLIVPIDDGADKK